MIFSELDNDFSGYPAGWVRHLQHTPLSADRAQAWFVGLVAAAGTMTPCCQVCTMSEEAHRPERTIPVVLIITTLFVAVIGFVLTIALVASEPAIEDVLGAELSQPAYIIFTNSLGNTGGGAFLFLMWFSTSCAAI